jgi:hypothetical protein
MLQDYSGRFFIEKKKRTGNNATINSGISIKRKSYHKFLVLKLELWTALSQWT